jgi:hypothetical protein
MIVQPAMNPMPMQPQPYGYQPGHTGVPPQMSAGAYHPGAGIPGGYPMYGGMPAPGQQQPQYPFGYGGQPSMQGFGGAPGMMMAGGHPGHAMHMSAPIMPSQSQFGSGYSPAVRPATTTAAPPKANDPFAAFGFS